MSAIGSANDSSLPDWACRALPDVESMRWLCESDYTGYVIAAYAVFALVLAWDYLAPRFAIARQLRAARRFAARRTARPTRNERPTELGR